MNRIYPISGVAMKDKVALIGYAPLTRHLVPWSDPEMDFWSLNERYIIPEHFQLDKISAHFQIHPYWNCTRSGNHNDPHHPEWLRSKHPFPIFMQKRYPDMPSSVEYPLDAVTAMYQGISYYDSGFAYMMALATFLQFKRIELYGFEMRSDTEYGDQLPNAEYLVGFARGKGIQVYMPPACNVCSPGPIYAYKTMQTVYRQRLEFRKVEITNSVNHLMADFNEGLGRVRLAREIIATPAETRAAVEWDKLYEAERVKTEKIKADLNVALGGQQENNFSLTEYDNYRKVEGVHDADAQEVIATEPEPGTGNPTLSS